MASDNRADGDDLITTFGRLVEAYSGLERRLGGILQERCGIPHSWFELMLRISRSKDGRIPMSVLAEQVALTSGGVTRIFDRMVAAGYAERVPCATDRRVVFAVLTPAGRAKLDQATQVHTANLHEVFAGFSPTQLRQLDRMLDRLRQVDL